MKPHFVLSVFTAFSFLVLTPFLSLAADDHGDSDATATMITVDDHYYEGVFETGDDTDAFVFDSKMKKKYLVKINFPEAIFRVSIDAADESTYHYIHPLSNNENANPQQYVVTPRIDGPVFLSLLPFYSNDYGPYKISVDMQGLGGTCGACQGGWDCLSDNCATIVFGGSGKVCIPSGETEYTCKVNDDGSYSDPGGGCLLNTLLGDFLR